MFLYGKNSFLGGSRRKWFEKYYDHEMISLVWFSG